METNLDNLDFSLADLFGWINLTLAALSKAENTACKSLADLLVRLFLIRDFKAPFRLLLRAVLTLSFLTFLIADLIIGMGANINMLSGFVQALMLKLKAHG